MANPAQIIRGVRRSQWVLDGAKALIGSTDVTLLLILVEAGFEAFRRKARKAFREHEPGILFTRAELLWMFDYLELHIKHEEATAAKNYLKAQHLKVAMAHAATLAAGDPVPERAQEAVH
jgi:hypothetical protein